MPTPSAGKKPRDRLKWLIQHGHIPGEYEDLGERILQLHEAKRREPHPHMQFDGGAGTGGKAGGALSRVSAGQRWERLFKWAGDDGEAVVTAVIVDGMTTDEAAKALNIHSKAVVPLLKFTLGVMGRTV
jgi:hypothetical protein